jgi:hypothetical protein
MTFPCVLLSNSVRSSAARCASAANSIYVSPDIFHKKMFSVENKFHLHDSG